MAHFSVAVAMATRLTSETPSALAVGSISAAWIPALPKAANQIRWVVSSV
jgi:hypothetical protein